MVSDYLKAMAWSYKVVHPKPNQYIITEGNSDSCPAWLNNQPRVADSNFNLQIPSLEKRDDFLIDAEKDGLANIFELEVADTSTTDNHELTLTLNANDQIHYIFITDDLGKIWYENEIESFQQILKIDTNHFPTGSYNILIENDGWFSAKPFVKAK